MLISSLGTLLLGEVLARLILPQDKMVTWIEMHKEGFVMNQSRGTAFQELDDRRADYRFNKHRLRGGEISSDKVNVLTIGDSFTFGLLLNEKNTYVHHLQQKADALFPDSIQFLNAAVGGSGLADWPKWLEHFGEALNPDYVIYFMNYKDINRALSKNLYVFDENEPDSLIKSQRWEPKTFLRNLGQKNWYRWLQAHSELANIAVKVLWKYAYFEDVTYNFDPEKSKVPIPSLNSFDENSEYSTRLANALLNRIDYWCDLNGCQFIIVNTGFFEKENLSMYDQKFYDWLQKPEQKTDMTYFDNIECVLSRIDSTLDEIRIPGDSHPNEEGAEIIADCTWNTLVNVLGNQ